MRLERPVTSEEAARLWAYWEVVNRFDRAVTWHALKAKQAAAKRNEGRNYSERDYRDD